MSIIISDFEPSGIPIRSVTARPSSLPISINGVPDTSRLHKAAFGDNLRWYLELPWPSETDPHVVQWVIIRSDGTEYAGYIPEGITGPLTLNDLQVTYGWGIAVPPPLGPIEDNLLPTVEGEITVIQGPTGPAPIYDLLANRPSASAAGDRTLFVATNLNGGTLFEVQTILGTPTWVQIGIGALDVRLSNSRVPAAHAPTHGSLGSDPVALDAGQITSGTLSLARLSGLSHSQLDASAGILGTQIHDVPATLVTGFLEAAQGGLGFDASGALARELVLGTGSGAFMLGFLASGDIPGLDASKIASGTLALSRLSGITGAQLSGTAGITSGQIASVAASTITGTISSAQFSLVPGDIPGLDAAKITSGTLALARLSGITTDQLSATAGIVSSQIASVLTSALQGTINSFNLSLVPGDIPGLDASKIISGTLALGRLSGITGGQLSGTAGITSGQIASVSTSTLVGIIGSSHLSLVPGDIPGLDASKITTGVFTVGLIPSLNAAKITSGALALARGGTGLDSSGATNGQLLIGTGSGLSLATLTAGDNITITNSSGGITIASIISSAVTSVGLAAPSEFSVSGSPVTGAGTLTFTKLNQDANLVYAGPTTGSSGAPVFRYLVAADIPTLPASRITGGQLATARGGTGLDTSSAANGQLLIGTGTGLALAVLTAGTGITITNTSGHIQIDGATTYTLPIASASVLGGIKVGSNLAIDGSGVLSGTYSYSLPIASASILGGVKQGANVTIDGSGIISVAAPYSLPTASASVLGGIKVGSGLSIDGSGILSATSGGGGTVTSIAITAPSEITVAGSPVTSSGTIALTWSSETQHFVFAGPSGSSGTPGFRALLASDIPVLSYVTSVALTVPADFGLSGSPITSSGTLGLTWNSQTGNVIMASPSGGGSGTPTFRSLVSADIPSLDVAKITTGTFATSFIPNLDTAKITTGTLSLARLSGITTTELSATAGIVAAQIASINPSVLTGTGTVPLAALSGITTTQLSASAGIVAAQIASVNPSVLTGSGAVPLAALAGITTTQLSATAGITSGQITSIPNQNASIITSGTLALARGGTNTDNSSQAQNLVWASPDGSTGTVTYRALVAADIPNLDTSKITTGTLLSARLPTADASNLGAIKVGTTLSIVSGVLDYTLPTASASVLGGIKVGSGLSISLGVLSAVNNGTVTSVAMTVPADFGISGSAITSSGTLGLTWNSQTGNVVMASPSGGGSGTPTFRSLVAADIPNLDASKITTGTLALARGGTAVDNSSQLQNLIWASPDGSTGAVTYRALVANDIPNLDTSKITTGTLSLSRLSGITTTQLSATAGIVAGQIASVNPSVLTGSGTVPLAGLSGITTTQLSATAGITSGQIASIPNQNASIITTGTLALARGGTNTDNSSQLQNLVWASPDGSTGAVTYRALVATDIPNLDASKITAGTLSSARLPTADASNLGAIKVGTTLSISSGVLDYNLPTASASVLGGIKVGAGLSISSGVLSSTTSGGTVTSVDLTAPSEISVAGSPITASGTLALTWASQLRSLFLASPAVSSGTPSFRTLQVEDLPATVARTDVANVFTQDQYINSNAGTGSGNFAGLHLQQLFTGTRKAGVIFGSSVLSTQWFLGNDANGNDSVNFFLYDYASSRTRLFMDSSGNLVVGGGIGVVTPTALGTLDIRVSSSSTVGAVIQGASGQIADLQQWQDSTPTTIAKIDKFGILHIPELNITADFGDGTVLYGGNRWFRTTSTSNTSMFVGPDGYDFTLGAYHSLIIQTNGGTASDVPLISRGITSQTGDLQQWQTVGPLTTVASISASGGLTLAGTLTLPSQTQNQVFAAPSGSSGVPGFRALRANDNPDILAMMWMEAS